MAIMPIKSVAVQFLVVCRWGRAAAAEKNLAAAAFGYDKFINCEKEELLHTVIFSAGL